MVRVLVVDDDATIRAMETRILCEAGYDVVVAKDGRSALDLATETLPDLILLDVMMPGLSGLEVARLLRASPATKKIPVLFVTSRTRASAMNDGFKAGGSAYLTKPFTRKRLLELVEELVST